MEPVRNHRNKRVVEAARLHRARVRHERGQTLLEGSSLISDALVAGCRVRELFARPDDETASRIARDHRLAVLPVDERALQRLAGTEAPRGPVAVADVPRDRLPNDRDVLVAWGVSDPGNVGTLVRSAAAFGWSFAYAEGTADPWAPKTLRAGAGGQFHTALKRIGGLGELDAWETVATVVDGGDDLSSVTAARIAVLVGEEALGLPDDIVRACSVRVTIPLPGPTQSLNAGIAGGIAVYELSKRSGQSGGGV